MLGTGCTVSSILTNIAPKAQVKGNKKRKMRKRGEEEENSSEQEESSEEEEEYNRRKIRTSKRTEAFNRSERPLISSVFSSEPASISDIVQRENAFISMQ